MKERKLVILADGKVKHQWPFTEDDKALVVENAKSLAHRMFMADEGVKVGKNTVYQKLDVAEQLGEGETVKYKSLLTVPGA